MILYFRDKTEKLENLKINILKEIESSDQEDKCLIEYRKELELLLQEKMAHVEELRQIHADINAVCLNTHNCRMVYNLILTIIYILIY